MTSPGALYLVCHLRGCNREVILWIYGVGLSVAMLGYAGIRWFGRRKSA